MESDGPPEAPEPDRMDAELTVAEAAVIGAMRENDRARDAIFAYATSFSG